MAKTLPGPNIDRTKLAVLPMLQKRDPHIIKSIESSGHVALYDFDDVKQSWARTQVEGSLHLVERDADPRYQLIIINKMNPENKIEDITPEFQIQNSDPYMFFKNRKGETHGIWFYNAAERERMCNFIDNLREEDMVVPPPAVPADVPMSSSPPSEGEENIMRFFSHLKTPSAATPAANTAPLPMHHTHLPPTHIQQGGPVAPLPPALKGMMQQPPSPGGTLPLPPPYPAQAHPSSGFGYVPPLQQAAPASPGVPAALSQMMAVAAAAKAGGQPTSIPPPQAKPIAAKPLTKQQLRDAIVKLASDDDFIDMVYNHYVASTQPRQ